MGGKGRGGQIFELTFLVKVRITLINTNCNLITARKRSLRRLCFYTCLWFYWRGREGACVVARGWVGHAWLLWGVWLLPGGGCMVAQGGCVWLLWGACMVAQGAYVVVPGGGGMHGCSRGACVVAHGGHAWLLLGGMCGCSQGGHAWLLPGGVHGIWRDTEIRSMGGRYTSYWNAFLFYLILMSRFWC